MLTSILISNLYYYSSLLLYWLGFRVVLTVRERMTGFGGQSPPRTFMDMIKYQGFMAKLLKSHFDENSVSLLSPPRAEGPVTYSAPQAIKAEVDRFRKILDERKAAGKKVFVEAFMTAPSPGIIACAMQNAYYKDMAAYVDALAKALKTEYKTIIDAGFILQIDAPDLAMERHTLFHDKPLSEFLAFMRLVIDAINKALEDIPRDRVRLHVWYVSQTSFPPILSLFLPN